MNKYFSFKFILKTKVIQIPSNFRFVNDVNPSILKILISTQKYKVKSNVNEDIFQSFINHWINNQTPNITFENLSQFIELSEEFQRMEDIVQIFQKNVEKYHIYDLNKKNDTLREKSKEKVHNLGEKKQQYNKILHTLFKNNKIDSYFRFLEVKKDLYNACKNENVQRIFLLTRKNIKHKKSGLSFVLDEEKMEAYVFNCNVANGDIIIPQSISYKLKNFDITTIVENSFKNSKDIRSIQFPKNSKLNIIEKSSFFQSSLEKIVIPSSVSVIDDFAFCECNQLRIVEFDENSQLQKIGKCAFCKSSIEKILMPSSLKQIGDFAFANCEHLKKVEFASNSNLSLIGNYAFSFTTIEHISIPSCVAELQEGWLCGNSNLIDINIFPSEKQYIALFDNKYIVGKSDNNSNNYDVLLFTKQSIQDAIIPSFIKRVAPYAFGGCVKLKSIEFSKDSNLKEIDKNAFINSNVSEISIPSSVVDFKEGWCCGTLNLISINICPNNMQNIKLIDNTFIIGKSNIKTKIFDVLLFARRDISNAIIPSYIKTIASYAFHSCTQLKDVIFPKDSKLHTIGSYAFCNSSLNEITIPEQVTSIGERSFSFCKFLKSIKFPHNSIVKKIEPYAFSNSSITNISIPSRLLHIGECSFANCNNFKHIKFSNCSKMQTIDKKAFLNSSIDSLFIPSQIDDIGDLAFSKCDYIQIVEIAEKSKLKSINKNIFNGSSLKLVMIPTILKEIVKS